MNDLVEYVYNEKRFRKALYIVDKEYRDDFKQHIILELYKKDFKSLKKLYDNDKLMWYIYGMVCNIVKDKEKKGMNKFWKEIIPKSDMIDCEYEEVKDDCKSYDVNVDDESLYDRRLDFLDKNMLLILDNFYYENNNSVEYFFNRQVFELYYLKGMTLMDISRATRISYSKVRESVYFTLAYVEKKIKMVK